MSAGPDPGGRRNRLADLGCLLAFLAGCAAGFGLARWLGLL